MGIYRDIALIVDNHMENKMENGMETRVVQGL